MRQLALPLCLPLVACAVQETAPDQPQNTDPYAYCKDANPQYVDTDGDKLSDCDELALKTDPKKADTDGDGLDDLKEVQCVSNPLDKNELCYKCGWFHNDPKNLASNGKAEGNVIGNMKLSDQCGETISLWDFANTAMSPTNVWAKLVKGFNGPKPEYHILFMTAAW